MVVLCLWGPGAAAASGWSIQRTPNPAGASYSVLSGVSCTSRTACTAVGHFTNRAGAGATLAERWNGTRWGIQPTPSHTGTNASLLFGVSCASATACTAVGSATNRAGVTTPLVEHWNGLKWSIQRTPEPAGSGGGAVSYLGDVSCPSITACAAVGYAGDSLGASGVALARRGNAGSWETERTPRPAGALAGFLSGVSCTSPTSCIAVGHFTNRAGAGLVLAERWDGRKWTIQPGVNPAAATDTQLLSVSCASPRSCTAVGFFNNISGIEVMLAEHWDGTRWAIARTLYPAGARFVQLEGVSCASPRSCTAVGFFNDVAGNDVILAEHFNGAGWTIQRTRRAGVADNSLEGVSCRTRTVCAAVGDMTNRAGTGVTLAERYLGH